jgi:uncharacterized protein
MRQTWHDLLFAHWRMDPEQMRAVLPVPLRPFLDLFGGAAWVGIIPFWMSNVRFRCMPPLPALSTFPECNVRTYLTIDGKPGVYFFSLDAASMMAVYGARMFNLMYYLARMEVKIGEDNRVTYWNRRVSKQKPGELRCRYSPAKPVFHHPLQGSLEHFLTERYCLYVPHADGSITRGNIHHAPWPLQPGWAEFETNTIASAHGIELPAEPPLLHYSKLQEVLIWGPERVEA